MNVRWQVMLRGFGLISALVMLTAGCVSQQKYDDLLSANRQSNADRERLRDDLASARARNKTLEDQMAGLRGTIGDKDQTIAMLHARIDDAGGKMSKMLELYELLVSKPTQPIINMLPAELDKALRDFAAKYPNLAQYDAERGVLKFGSDVVFDLGSDEVKSEAVQSLQELATIIASPAAADFDAVIVGHTDNVQISKPETRMKHPTNWHLSVHRAISVMKILRDAGVDPGHMGVMGYGEYRPVLPNDTAANRAKNRRVELFLVPHHATGTVAEETAAPEPAGPEK